MGGEEWEGEKSAGSDEFYAFLTSDPVLASMNWHLSYKADPPAARIADRHYNRHKVGSAQFLPPGRSLALLSDRAVWATSWPFAEYVKHAWAGAWVNSLFRNEGPILSSTLIREAVAATRWRWPDIPELGMVTFVDPRKVRPKKDPGYCYLKAGFERVGETVDRKFIVWQLLPDRMPDPLAPIGGQATLALDALHGGTEAESRRALA